MLLNQGRFNKFPFKYRDTKEADSTDAVEVQVRKTGHKNKNEKKSRMVETSLTVLTISSGLANVQFSPCYSLLLALIFPLSTPVPRGGHDVLSRGYYHKRHMGPW